MKFRILLIVLLLLVCALPTFAQEATANPTTPSVEATPEPPVVVIPPASDTIQLTWTSLVGLITIIMTVGVAGGAGGAIAIIRLVRNNEAIMFSMEKLFLSASPETQKLLRGGVNVVKEGATLADELTDGVIGGAKVRVQ